VNYEFFIFYWIFAIMPPGETVPGTAFVSTVQGCFRDQKTDRLPDKQPSRPQRANPGHAGLPLR
jgi:hypothetical protein